MDGVFRARIDAKPAPTDDLAPTDLEAVERREPRATRIEASWRGALARASAAWR